MRALFTAATGMEAQQLKIDTVANNIANVTTTGFKRSRADFHDLFYETVQAAGAPTCCETGHCQRIRAGGSEKSSISAFVP